MSKFGNDFPGHICHLVEENDSGLPKLPPNAPFSQRLVRWYRKMLAPNINLSIARRNYRNISQIKAEIRRHANSKFFYIIHPYSYMELILQLFFLIVGTWTILVNPILGCFKWTVRNVPVMVKHESKVLMFSLHFLAPCQIIWIISCFFTGIRIMDKKKYIELNHLKIIIRYVLGYFIIDLVMLEPLLDRLKISTVDDVGTWLHFLLAFRCWSIAQTIKRFLRDFMVPPHYITIALFTIMSGFILHFFSCLFLLAPLMFSPDINLLWVSRTQLIKYHSLHVVYFGCLNIVQTHFWGLGGSQVSIEDNTEKLVLTIVMIVGRIWSLFITAAVLRILSIDTFSDSKYEEYLIQLKTFINQQNLPKDMGERLLEYYEYKFQRHYFNEKIILAALSNYLKQELMLFSAKNVVDKVVLFKNLPRSIVGNLLEKCKKMVYLNNDLVFKMGEPIKQLAFISYGTLALFNSDQVELIHLTDGSEIGLISYLKTDARYRFSYVAIESTEIYCISVKDFRHIINGQYDILKFFKMVVTERTKHLDEIETQVMFQGNDFQSQLRHRKILEHPIIRTRVFTD